MSHVLNCDGEYFRVEIAEVTDAADATQTSFVSWCSEAFDDLKQMPSRQALRFIGGPPQHSHAEALRYAFDWVRGHGGAPAKRSKRARDLAQVIYTVWIFKQDGSTGFEFEEFADARAFASAAEKSHESIRVAVTNNESPQSLTVWERTR